MRTYSRDAITLILDIFQEFDFYYRASDGELSIDQEIVDYANENNENNLLDNLLDYKIKIKSDRDHRNDGQMVDYDFTFTSPDGKITKFSTEMCLMVGWNHCDEETIK